VLQAIDGPGQSLVFRRQPDILQFQALPVLAQAIDAVQTPMAEQNQENEHQGQTNTGYGQKPVFLLSLLGLLRRSRLRHRSPPQKLASL
jgi:hypothetical protein